MKPDTTSSLPLDTPSYSNTSTTSSPSKKEEAVYEIGDIFHLPLDYYNNNFRTAIARWKKGVKVVQENPPSSYLEGFHIFTGPWSLHGWGEWYRLLDADGSQYLDYYILSDKEVHLYDKN